MLRAHEWTLRLAYGVDSVLALRKAGGGKEPRHFRGSGSGSDSDAEGGDEAFDKLMSGKLLKGPATYLVVTTR